MPRSALTLVLGLVILAFTQPGDAYAARPKDFSAAPVSKLFKSNPYRLRANGMPIVKRGTAPGDVKVEISRNSQQMNVYVAGRLMHTWAVSTGRKGFTTPGGAYRPTWMTPLHHSKQWNNAPMPHAVFFREGVAIHGTNETGRLGRPASHGCVRLAPSNAAKLFQMIRAHGEKKTKIVVS